MTLSYEISLIVAVVLIVILAVPVIKKTKGENKWKRIERKDKKGTDPHKADTPGGKTEESEKRATSETDSAGKSPKSAVKYGRGFREKDNPPKMKTTKEAEELYHNDSGRPNQVVCPCCGVENPLTNRQCVLCGQSLNGD